MFKNWRQCSAIYRRKWRETMLSLYVVILRISFFLQSLLVLHTNYLPVVTATSLDDILSRRLVITSIELEPYLMPMYIHDNGTYIKVYQGFVVDLVYQLSQMLNFDYELIPEPEGKYGHRNSRGLWDGMIGLLQRKKADIAAAPLYITEYREKVVDFTVPFLDVSATLLLRKPPVGVQNPINSVSDLLNQSEIKYGTLNTGLFIWAFRNTNDSMLKILWRNIQRYESELLTETNDDGIEKVRKEKYAFIIPSSIGEYVANQRPCDLITVDRFLMETGYGLAVPKDSPLLPVLNSALTELKHSGFLHRLYKTWWYDRTECSDVIMSSKIYDVSCARRKEYGFMIFMLFISRLHL